MKLDEGIRGLAILDAIRVSLAVRRAVEVASLLRVHGLSDLAH